MDGPPISTFSGFTFALAAEAFVGFLPFGWRDRKGELEKNNDPTTDLCGEPETSHMEVYYMIK